MSQRIVSVEPSTLNHHGVVCDLFVYRDASLMRQKNSMQTEQIHVLNHNERKGED